jgi:hypothetical protein
LARQTAQIHRKEMAQRFVSKIFRDLTQFWSKSRYKFPAQGDVEVGKLKIVKYPGQKSQVSLSLSDTTLQIDAEEKIPKDHRFDVQAVNKQTLGVFSQVEGAEKILMEGTIVEKLECRPYADATYMNMKAKSIKIAAQPKRKVEQLESVVSNFKPISDHKHNVSWIAVQTCIFMLNSGSFYLNQILVTDWIRKEKEDRRKEIAYRQECSSWYAL